MDDKQRWQKAQEIALRILPRGYQLSSFRKNRFHTYDWEAKNDHGSQMMGSVTVYNDKIYVLLLSMYEAEGGLVLNQLMSAVGAFDQPNWLQTLPAMIGAH